MYMYGDARQPDQMLQAGLYIYMHMYMLNTNIVLINVEPGQIPQKEVKEHQTTYKYAYVAVMVCHPALNICLENGI